MPLQVQLKLEILCDEEKSSKEVKLSQKGGFGSKKGAKGKLYQTSWPVWLEFLLAEKNKFEKGGRFSQELQQLKNWNRTLSNCFGIQMKLRLLKGFVSCISIAEESQVLKLNPLPDGTHPDQPSRTTRWIPKPIFCNKNTTICRDDGDGTRRPRGV